VASAFAVAPVAAQADTTAQGLLTAGSLVETAPAITAFPTTLTGATQTVNTAVGAWNVMDASGSNAGYTVTVSSSAPTDTALADGTGTHLSTGTGGSITLTPTAATAHVGYPETTGPVDGAGATTSLTPILVSTGTPTVASAAAATGQGSWDFAGAGNLAVVIPGNASASAGYYTSTLTYTAAPLA
jgi:WxL domain surface cell wall-binding